MTRERYQMLLRNLISRHTIYIFNKCTKSILLANTCNYEITWHKNFETSYQLLILQCH